ncbi:type II toxin-antitoxin system RelE/ParE family toxin [Zavarzinella formosa]|uniref:type II toxin-antitoxin system RelE/ParE family toxin n=1 Tax=Zavarzinella formosa TaxID=360055 RepID=UPI000907710E
MKPVAFHRLAERDVENAAFHYETLSTGLGQKFTEVAFTLVNDIANSPGLGSPYGRNFRFRVIRRFPYVIFYREYDDLIWIVAIVHNRRRPKTWAHRDRLRNS